MTAELMTSSWSADDSPMVKRVEEALGAVSRTFEIVQRWESEHTHRTDEASRLRATTAAHAAAIGPDLPALWRATLEHVASQDFPAEQLYTSASVYSEIRRAGVLVAASEQRLSISCDTSDLRTALGGDRDLYSTLLKDLGRCPAIGGCWLRHRAAFAGRPAWLYIPKVPFAKLDDALRYEQVTDEVRRIRNRLAGKLTTELAMDMLRGLGADPEVLGTDRLYVELGDPLGDGGASMLKALEKQVGKLIK